MESKVDDLPDQDDPPTVVTPPTKHTKHTATVTKATHPSSIASATRKPKKKNRAKKKRTPANPTHKRNQMREGPPLLISTPSPTAEPLQAEGDAFYIDDIQESACYNNPIHSVNCKIKEELVCGQWGEREEPPCETSSKCQD